MHVWNATNGPVQVECGPLRPSVFEPNLYLRDGTGTHLLTGANQGNDVYLFNIAAATVQDMLTGDAYLFLITRQVLKPNAPDLRWGWRYRVSQNQQSLAATDENGNALPIDAAGFFNSSLEKFDQPVELSRETIVLK